MAVDNRADFRSEHRSNEYRYSQHARRAISHARLLARQNVHSHLDSAHLLLGILHEEGSIGCNILRELALDTRRVERAFRQLFKTGDGEIVASPEPTRTLQEALSLAADESRWLGQHYVGTEHLLLGLTRSNEESLQQLLYALDVNPEQVRRRARRVLQDGITEISLEQARRVTRLSELTRRVLYGAEQLAEQMRHSHVGLAHLLMALCREQRSICAKMLHENGLDEALLQTNLSKSRPALGGMLDDMIDQAIGCAEAFGSHYIGTDHLLLTMAQDRRGRRLLRKYGVDPAAIAQKMREQLSR